jgi:hypothetical protein
MRKLHAFFGWATVLLMVGTVLVAHPHMQKSVTVKIGDVEAKVSFYTSPANLEHVKTAAIGAFTPGAGRLNLSADLTVGDITLAAGEYRVGAIKNGEDDWTLALYQGQLKRGESVDMAKVIKLASWFSKYQGNAAHINFDLTPGHGEMEGKVTLVWHYGPLYLAGALS